MFTWEKGTEIAIWGTGKCARKFYLRYCHYFKVRFFIDNFPKKDKLDQIDILTPDQVMDGKKIKIVIAIEDYQEVCDQCKQMGMEFFDGYLPYKLINFNSLDFIKLCENLETSEIETVFRKIIKNKPFSILIGNCQISAVRQILLSSRQFRENYFILDIPPVHVITQNEMEIIEKYKFIFTECSLCVTQYINFDNNFSQFFATENIRRLVNYHSRLIVIPVLYFDLYFPQTIHQKQSNSLLSEVGVLSFPYGDCILDELSKKYSIEDIVKIVCLKDFFPDKLLRWIYDTRLEEMQYRESLCDVKIYDYIIEHFRKEQLFYSKNHPSRNVFIEFGKRLLNRLGFSDAENVEQIRMPILDGWQEIIYPSVASYYKLCFDKTMYLDQMVDEECDLEEIIWLYLITICGEKR